LIYRLWPSFLNPMHRKFLLPIECSRDGLAEVTFTFDSGEKSPKHVDYALSVNECKNLVLRRFRLGGS
jgi:hypothetical protein